MIKFERVSVMNWENAIRGARNPMNSWEKSDSRFGCKDCEGCYYEPLNNTIEVDGTEAHWCDFTGLHIGTNDLALLMRLRNAGTDHRKFMRQIFVSVDITAPLYWWKEFDTYKVGTAANSCSTMHRLTHKPFEVSDFSHEHLYGESMMLLESIIHYLNVCRDSFVLTKDRHLPANYIKQEWWQMIQLLPSSYNQLRTVTLNYEVLANMYAARKEHKLDEWRDLCEWIKTLPYHKLITGEDEAHEDNSG